jgi:16S rRNA (uracil1498-N3)-methyltransferase
MADRYFVDSTIDGPRAILSGPEAHHLAHVMRAKPGDRVILFDGSGAEFTARVEKVGRAEVELEVLSREPVDCELPVRLTVGVALPKGDRQRWLVEKLVELGVSRLAPLVTDRAGEQTLTSIDRLRRAVIEASKQCGRNRLMEIDKPQVLAEFLASPPTGAIRLLAQPGGKDCRQSDWVLGAARPADVLLAIGPEGGFAETEVEAAVAAGWQPVSLGRRILRIETAALAIVAAIALRLEATDEG